MFQKKQKIYSETQGVCIVENIVQLPAGKGGSRRGLPKADGKQGCHWPEFQTWGLSREGVSYRWMQCRSAFRKWRGMPRAHNGGICACRYSGDKHKLQLRRE